MRSSDADGGTATPELNDDEMMVDLDVEYAFSKKVSVRDALQYGLR